MVSLLQRALKCRFSFTRWCKPNAMKVLPIANWCCLSFAKLVEICLKYKHWATFYKICCTRSLSQPFRLSPSRFPPAGVGLFLKDQPYGVVNLLMLRGSVDAVRQHCPTKGLTPMGLLVDETMRKRYKFTRKIWHVYVLLIQSNYKLEYKRAKHSQQAFRLSLWRFPPAGVGSFWETNPKGLSI